jgi:hypothetical protein
MEKRYFRTHSKFGVELAKTVERALQINKETGTTFWGDAIAKEMKTVMVVFEILHDGSKAPVGHTYLDCHIICDVKPTLVRKARCVASGHMTGEPESLTYASVVSRGSVRLSLMLAALNGLDMLQADVKGACLNAKNAEKLYTRCGPEFGEFKDRLAVIRRALRGTKTAAASWRATILKVIKDLGFEMCLADNDVWMRRGANREVLGICVGLL